MIKPTKPVDYYTQFGFKKCKGEYGKNNCYYLCINRGQKMIFLSKERIEILEWQESDYRIHSNPNCRYLDQRTALDIVCELVANGLAMVEY